MSYENPITPVDTQSGQHWRNLQESMTNILVGIGKSYIDRKKEIQGNIQKGIEEGLKLSRELTKNTTADKSINWQETYGPIIDEYSKLHADILNGAGDPTENAKKMRLILSSVDSTKSTIAGSISLSDGYMKSANNYAVGTANGVSANMDPIIAKAVSIYADPNRKGNLKMRVDPSKNYESFLDVYDEKGELLKTFNSAQIAKLSTGGGELMQYVPDTVQGFQDKINSKGTIFEMQQKKGEDGKVVSVPTNIISEKYLLAQMEDPSITPGTEVSTMGGVAKSFQKTLYREVNKAAIMQDLDAALSADASANLSNPIDVRNQVTEDWATNPLLKGKTDPLPSNVPFNDVDSDGKKDQGEAIDPIWFTTEEGKKWYTDNYKKAYEATLPPRQVVKKEASDTATRTYEASTSKGGNKNNQVNPTKMNKWNATVAKNTALYNQYKGKGFPANKPLFSINAQDPGKYIIFKNNEWHLMQVGGKTTSYEDAETLQKINSKSDSEVSTFPGTPEGSTNAFKAIGFN